MRYLIIAILAFMLMNASEPYWAVLWASFAAVLLPEVWGRDSPRAALARFVILPWAAV
jgi:hypothetical protein